MPIFTYVGSRPQRAFVRYYLAPYLSPGSLSDLVFNFYLRGEPTGRDSVNNAAFSSDNNGRGIAKLTGRAPLFGRRHRPSGARFHAIFMMAAWLFPDDELDRAKIYLGAFGIGVESK